MLDNVVRPSLNDHLAIGAKDKTADAAMPHPFLFSFGDTYLPSCQLTQIIKNINKVLHCTYSSRSVSFVAYSLARSGSTYDQTAAATSLILAVASITGSFRILASAR